MRIRSRWWVLSVFSVLGATSGAYAQHDPLAFASLGTLNISSGTLTINTDTLAMSGAATFTGVSLAQTGGPQIAVFDFTSITIGAGVTVNITGSRALSLLSRGTTTIATNLTSTSQLGGYVGGSVNLINNTAGNAFGAANPGTGPGGGSAFVGPGLTVITGGGGHGGNGGGVSSNVNYGGISYGNLFTTSQGGSGGGAAGFVNGVGILSTTGGNGGGTIEVTAANGVSVAGMTLNGNNGGGAGISGGGGGAGGGILLYGLYGSGVTATGTLSVNGGNGTGQAGGGAGGRIALGLTSYTLGASSIGVAGSLNGGTGTLGIGYAGVGTIDAASTTVPNGFNITLNGNPVNSIAGSTTQTSGTIEAYVRKDLIINSGGTATLGLDNALRRMDANNNNVTSLTVNGTFNTSSYSQSVAALGGIGTINLGAGGSINAGINPTGFLNNFSGTLIGAGSMNVIGQLFSGSGYLFAPTIASGSSPRLSGTMTGLTLNGSLVVDAGNTLAVGSITGNGAISIGNGGILSVGGNGNSTISGNISGLGSLVVYNDTTTISGLVLLNQATINGGTLQVGNGTGAGFIGSNIANFGTLMFNLGNINGGSDIFSEISGTGTLQKLGSGIVRLNRASTYTGPTDVIGGTLQPGNALALGNNSYVTVYSGATLDLGSNSVAVGSLTGSGTVTGSGTTSTLTVGGNNISTTFSGTFSAGRLVKVGTGTLLLTGSGSPTSELAVDGGILGMGTTMNPPTTRIGPDGTLNFYVNGVSLNSTITGIGSTSTININANNILLGSLSSFNGFNHQGTLSVGANTVTLNSAGFAQLGSLTSLGGGTINATNGVAFGSGSNFDGNGTINAKVSGQQGSIINASNGNLSLGSNSIPAGFITAGELRTNANTVTLNSSSRATLGSLTTLGSGGSPGTVAATNGVLVDFGNSLVGYGTINTPNNLIQRSIINGTVQGNSGAQPVTFTGWVKGVGTFTNVVFAGTWDPGFSPTLITAGSIGFSSTNNLIMELGGLTRGSQFDGIDAIGNVNLAGALSITRINGFNPNTADVFVLINRTGGTGTFTGLNEGDTFHGVDGGTYIISYQGMNYMTNMMAPGANSFSVVIAAVPEPMTWALISLGVGGCSWAGYRRYRKNNSLLDAEVVAPE